MAFQKGQSGNPAGRRKGATNKVNALLRDAIIEAANNAGGKEGLVGYLQTQAREHPTAFMSLLGRVLPFQAHLTGEPDEPVNITITHKIVKPPKRTPAEEFPPGSEWLALD